MKPLFRCILELVMLAASATALADVVVINDGYYGQGQMLTIAEGQESGDPIIVGRASIFGQRFDIFFTEVGSNIISDHLFSRSGTVFPGESDDILFSSDGMNDLLLGTTCAAGQTCIEENGLMQDVSQAIINIIGINNWCGGGGTCNISVQSDTSEVPEPASVALFGVALAALSLTRRKQS